MLARNSTQVYQIRKKKKFYEEGQFKFSSQNSRRKVDEVEKENKKRILKF